MKRIQREFTAMVLAGGSLLPVMAQAQPVLAQRCNVDSLTAAEAEARLRWARDCALNLHSDTATGYPIGVPSSNGDGELIEYEEYPGIYNPSGKNAYTGQVFSAEVNSSFAYCLYSQGPTQQVTDPYDFKAWCRSGKTKVRPLYPTFGSMADIYNANNKQLFPHPRLQNCMLFYDKQGTQLASTGHKAFYINAYCESSCYTPEQKIRFAQGEHSILEALQSRREDVVVLDSHSTLEDIRFQVGTTYSYTEEFRDSEHPLVELRTASGGRLRVTVDHPLVNGEGRMVQAQTLAVGDSLIRQDGSRDEIREVKRTQHFGKVYNLRPTSESLVSNVLVAEGFLVGSSLFQNDASGYLNRVILYSSALPPEAIP